MTPGTRTLDAVVVGAGVMGSATAWSLARRGLRVVVLERFEIGHRRGSSHGTSRIFRLSYDDPRYVAMAMEALPRWRKLEREAGEPLLTTLGGLDYGKDLGEHVAALEASGARHEVVDGAWVRRRYPLVALPEDEPVLHQPDAGIVAADRAVRAFLAVARSHGAEVRERTSVLDLAVDGDRAVVGVACERLTASVVVVTAGAWARGLLAGAGIALETTPSRETVAYFAVGDGPLPTLVDWTEPLTYALPAPAHGLKAAEHRAGPETDPEEEGEPSEASVTRLSAWVARRYPSADPRPHLVETCLYTNTADEHFVLERHGPVVVGSACSGHGFKFAPFIGDRLAALAMGEPPPGGAIPAPGVGERPARGR